jgi:hypothetical protein
MLMAFIVFDFRPASINIDATTEYKIRDRHPFCGIGATWGAAWVCYENNSENILFDK